MSAISKCEKLGKELRTRLVEHICAEYLSVKDMSWSMASLRYALGFLSSFMGASDAACGGGGGVDADELLVCMRLLKRVLVAASNMPGGGGGGGAQALVEPCISLLASVYTPCLQQLVAAQILTTTTTTTTGSDKAVRDAENYLVSIVDKLMQSGQPHLSLRSPACLYELVAETLCLARLRVIQVDNNKRINASNSNSNSSKLTRKRPFAYFDCLLSVTMKQTPVSHRLVCVRALIENAFARDLVVRCAPSEALRAYFATSATAAKSSCSSGVEQLLSLLDNEECEEAFFDRVCLALVTTIGQLTEQEQVCFISYAFILAYVIYTFCVANDTFLMELFS